jgi:hypothetical protein
MKLKALLLTSIALFSVVNISGCANSVDTQDVYQRHYGEYDTESVNSSIEHLANKEFNRGWKYQMGEGMPKDYEEAVKWYRKAANKDHTQAQYNLAQMYRRGQGVLKDDKEATKWYKKAANKGHVGAKDVLNPTRVLERQRLQYEIQESFYHRPDSAQILSEIQEKLDKVKSEDNKSIQEMIAEDYRSGPILIKDDAGSSLAKDIFKVGFGALLGIPPYKMLGEKSGGYSDSCPCPYDRASDGSRCGARSAYSRSGGYEPKCY